MNIVSGRRTAQKRVTGGRGIAHRSSTCHGGIDARRSVVSAGAAHIRPRTVSVHGCTLRIFARRERLWAFLYSFYRVRRSGLVVRARTLLQFSLLRFRYTVWRVGTAGRHLCGRLARTLSCPLFLLAPGPKVRCYKSRRLSLCLCLPLCLYVYLCLSSMSYMSLVTPYTISQSNRHRARRWQ